MKTKLLIGSAVLVTGATALSIANMLLTKDPETILRLTGVSWTLGLGSIGLFFVGLAFPKSKE